jgi:hypothetical protein
MAADPDVTEELGVVRCPELREAEPMTKRASVGLTRPRLSPLHRHQVALVHRRFDPIQPLRDGQNLGAVTNIVETARSRTCTSTMRSSKK